MTLPAPEALEPYSPRADQLSLCPKPSTEMPDSRIKGAASRGWRRWLSRPSKLGLSIVGHVLLMLRIFGT